jgi:selenide,water dikinase
MLKNLPKVTDPRVLIGRETSDDAGVYKLTEDIALVQTLDFFSPMTDDPYLFGQIAAANSLSDVYAMGGQPLTALNIVCYASCIDAEVMAEVLRGAADKAGEAGVVIIGGHSVENEDVKFGMSVTGVVHPERIVSNGGAQSGDALILTKPLGCGIVLTAHKAGLVDDQAVRPVLTEMARLNKDAAEIFGRYGVKGGTDITGFGLVGHALEVARASNVSIELWAGQIPLYPGSREHASMGLVPGGAYRNAEYYGDSVSFAEDVPEDIRDVLFDPQTSGGLLFAVPAHCVAEIVLDLHKAGITAAHIGKCTDDPAALLKVLSA